jgi:hypothetical protein
MAVLKALMSCPLWKQLQLVVVPLTAAAARQIQSLSLPYGSFATTIDLSTVSDELRKRRTAGTAAARSLLQPSSSPSSHRRVCYICHTASADSLIWQCNGCASATHVVCLAKHSNPSADTILPAEGRCPACGAAYPWCRVVAQVQPLADEDDDEIVEQDEDEEQDEEEEEEEEEAEYEEDDVHVREEEHESDDDAFDAGDLTQQNCYDLAGEDDVVDLTQL